MINADNHNREFVRLLAAYEPQIRGSIMILVPDWHDAQDIMQKVCVVLWSKFSNFQQGTSFLAWAMAIAKLEVKDHWKRKKRERMRFSSEFVDLVTVNVLDKLPRGRQVSAKNLLHEIWMSATKADATKAMDPFVATYRAKFPKAVECLIKDKEQLLAFYDFPAEHWAHLRTSNPIESTFATVRLRTSKTKGGGSRAACLAMAFKLVQSAQNHWRKLNGSTLLPAVVAGAIFKDGTKIAT